MGSDAWSAVSMGIGEVEFVKKNEFKKSGRKKAPVPWRKRGC
jgi:hypothetical protein